MRQKLFLLLLLLSILTSGGCSNSGDGRPMAPTEVIVTYKGSPVEGADVTFVTVDDNTPAFGLTGKDGVAKMTTYQPGDGAIVTEHNISVKKMFLDKKLTDVPQISQEDPDYDPRDPPSVQPPKNQLPQKYALPTTSGLKWTIEAGKVNKVELKLE